MGDKKLLESYAWKAIAAQTRELLIYQQGVLNLSSSEDLHRFRVALRRISNLFHVFKENLSTQTIRKQRRCIKDAARKLGPARDLDIHIGLVQAFGARLPGSQRRLFEEIVQELKNQRNLQQKKVAQALKSLEKNATTSFLKQNANLHSCKNSSRKKKDIVKFGKKVTLKNLNHFLDFSVGALGIRQGKKLHQLRLKAKKLRYTLESFAKVFGPQAVDMANKTRLVQAALGELHDLETLILFIEKQRFKQKGRSKDFFLQTKKFFNQKKVSAYQKFLKLWEENQMKGTWQSMDHWLSSL